MKTTTDTPRTDAYNNNLGVVPADFARQLERELAASHAEVASLKRILENVEYGRDCVVEDRNLIDKELAEAKAEVERLTKSLQHTELWGSFEKQVEAQGEIKRLNANLRRAIEIAEIFAEWIGEYEGDDCGHDLRAELDQIKATLNQDNK